MPLILFFTDSDYSPAPAIVLLIYPGFLPFLIKTFLDGF